MIQVYRDDVSAWNDKTKLQKGRKRVWVDELKQSVGCIVCGEENPSCLEFHHVSASNKEHDISQMIVNKASDERIREEIDKCLILCANCHRKVHRGYILIV
jgi:hypothetical protein